MFTFKKITSPYFIFRHLLKWTLWIVPLAVVIGSVIALFLWLLDWATKFRFLHPWILFLLPFSGVLIYFLYKLSGKNASAGNNLIIDEIHEPGGGVPLRMAPLVLLTTIITHLFGGSAGREGTAVQIGGSFAGLLAKKAKFNEEDISVILTAGIAAGFGAVFGTPLTGAVFAMEVLAIGQVKYNALLPCLMASIIADVTCAAWGIHHTQYRIANLPEAHKIPFFKVDILLIIKVIIAGIAFGLASRLFATLTEQVKHLGFKLIKTAWLVPVAGGILIIALTYLLGTRDYLGIGIVSDHPNGVSLVAAFHAGGATNWSWFWKILFTAVTLGTGFKGGEVTPLFFIGATLGNIIAVLFGVPVDLLAGLGFIAVFAGATNTPLACTLMGVELFGGGNLLYYAIACFTAYYFSGKSGIYSSQRKAVFKAGVEA
ncbi:voltage-gated chloride channel family protein [Mucilaginibacter arboris]|uniref:Voltage-gated chloride channel protein n=1 Tax=Mucilaginibacter arboris TaxID=2682090 RepID=A0A7K1T0L9_9SPHI|nr:voltage-gated chloride channel family protein [Mucilaginibacter arboris]MVN23105.1 voltage-gated chloride channel protein [Mucilaginibacter arboris]